MAAPAFGTAGTFLNGATSTSAAVAVPASVAAGDIILVHLHVGSSTAPSALPSGFAEVVPTGTQFTTGTVAGIRSYWKRATGADSGTYTFTWASSVNKSAVATRYTGCITTGGPFDTSTGAPVTAVRSSAGTTTPAVSLTTQGADRLLVWAGAAEGLAAWTPPTGYTERVDTTRDLSIATVAQATAGATGSVTGTGANAFQMGFLVALLPQPATQTINAGTVTAPAAPFQPVLDQTFHIFPDTVTAPAAPPNPQIVPGAVTIFPNTVAGPSTPPSPKLQMVVHPNATPSVSAVYEPSLEVGPRPRLRIDFWALDDDASVLCPLPHPIAWDLSMVPGEAGAVKIEYPAAGLNYDVLDERVTRYRDLRIKIRTNGKHGEALGALLHARDGDDVTEGGTVTFYGKFLTALLGEAPLPYNVDDEKGEWTYVDGTAGSILADVLDTVQDGDYLDGVGWAFTDTHDSNGEPWATETSAVFSPGRTALQVAQQLRKWGMVEFEVVDDENGDLEVRAYEPTVTGTDHTQSDPPLVLRRGRDLTDAPRKTDVSDAATSLLVAGKDGVYVEVNDPSAIAQRGRKIGQYLSEGNLTTQGAASAYGHLELSRRTEGVDEITHSLVFDQDQVLPLRDLKPLDWVYSDLLDGEGVGTRERVAQITVSQPAGSDHYQGGVVLRDLCASRDQAVQRRLDGIAGGQIVTGTSAASAQVDDGKAPAQVQGVAVASGAYLDDEGKTFAAVTATWLEVEDNFDGSPMSDFDHYDIQYRYASGSLPTGWVDRPSTPDESAQWDGVVPGVLIKVRVRAVDRYCRVGAWSDDEDHATADDATAPPVPSTPDVQSYLGILTIEWDGLGSVGEPMPADFARVDIYASKTSGFTPSSATYIDSLRGAGVMPSTIGEYGETWYAKLISVDKSGNASAASAQDSAVLAAAGDGDISAVSIGKLTAGIMSALMTVSGIIRTSSTGAGWEADTDGFRFYDGDRTPILEYDVDDESLEITGTVQTGMTGRRVAMSGAGNDIRFYPQVGETRFARLFSYIPTNFLNDIAVEMRAIDSDDTTVTSRMVLLPDTAFVSVTDPDSEETPRATLQVNEDLITLAVQTGDVDNNFDGGHLSLTRTATNRFTLAAADGAGADDSVIVGRTDRMLHAVAGVTETEITADGTFTEGLYGFNSAIDYRAAINTQDGPLICFYWASGALQIGDHTAGTFIKTFVIDHPTRSDRHLVHATTESPSAGVEYWGTVTVEDGEATVELPDYFEALTRTEGRNVQLTVLAEDNPQDRLTLPRTKPRRENQGPRAHRPKSPSQRVDLRRKADQPPQMQGPPPGLPPTVQATYPRDGRFTIYGQGGPDTYRVMWLVKAIRADVPELEVEPLRSSSTVRGDGPYTWIDGARTRD